MDIVSKVINSELQVLFKFEEGKLEKAALVKEKVCSIPKVFFGKNSFSAVNITMKHFDPYRPIQDQLVEKKLKITVKEGHLTVVDAEAQKLFKQEFNKFLDGV